MVSRKKERPLVDCTTNEWPTVHWPWGQRRLEPGASVELQHWKSLSAAQQGKIVDVLLGKNHTIVTVQKHDDARLMQVLPFGVPAVIGDEGPERAVAFNVSIRSPALRHDGNIWITVGGCDCQAEAEAKAHEWLEDLARNGVTRPKKAMVELTRIEKASRARKRAYYLK